MSVNCPTPINTGCPCEAQHFSPKEPPDLKVTIRINSETYGRFDIEMQTTCNEYLWKRFLHSACKMYAEQIIEGDKYTKLNNTFTLIIYSCNFIKEDDACCHIYSVNDPVYNIVYKHSFQIHTIELPKRNTLFENKHLKNNKNLKELSKWLDFFSSSNNEDEYMNAAGECVEMQDAFKMIKVMSMDKDERGMADAAMYARANEAAMYDEGYEDRAVKTAIDMIKDNEPTPKIVKYSGLSPERINKIKADLNNYSI